MNNINENINENINITNINELIKPKILREQLPVTSNIQNQIKSHRETIENILNGLDNRFLVIVGPCSIHNPDEAYEYAKSLKILSEKYNSKLFIVMRVYFEKPRTTIGWKGLINDPDLDNSCNINKGLLVARHLMLEIAKLNIPIGCEFLDTISPQFISDLVSWGAIGARTTESQCHRQLASGLSMPIGFKNGTGGSIKLAVDAILSSRYPHTFLGINLENNSSIIKTNGNKNTHIILRGGSNGPNYDAQSVQNVSELMLNSNLNPNIIIDCSHANSNKDFRNQPKVAENVGYQILSGNKFIKGVMIESNINEGNQDISTNMLYGVSVTDSCISLETTDMVLSNLSNCVKI
jgi:3-deoxy-7-phosphoheptulonate synthase